MSEQPAIALFTEVDQTRDPRFFTRFLDAGNALPTIRASKPLILDGLRLQGGEAVLDAGCGMGADVFDLAQRVGPAGRVVGIDVSEVMIAEARRRAAGLQLPVEFEVGDAQQLRFADARFDACRTERMLMHVPDAERAFSELVRVTRAGGRVAVFDFDWDTLVIDSPVRETTRAVVRSFSDSNPPRVDWSAAATPLPRGWDDGGERAAANHHDGLRVRPVAVRGPFDPDAAGRRPLACRGRTVVAPVASGQRGRQLLHCYDGLRRLRHEALATRPAGDPRWIPTTVAVVSYSLLGEAGPGWFRYSRGVT